MSIINTEKIETAVKNSFLEICCRLDAEVLDCLKKCRGSNELESFALDVLVKNAEIAEETRSPVCQDTGMAVVFLDIGQDVRLVGKFINDSVNDGVRAAYEGFRKSVVTPLSRKNTADNTPAVIHTRIVPGDTVTVSCLAKGFGSENMSRVFMLTPANGTNGVIANIVKAVSEAGSCPCPPVIIGVGIGGTMELAAIMSKRALLRKINTPNPNPSLDMLEEEILGQINALGIGAEGFSGKVTALKVLIESAPTHIAGLPVAVTVQCHCSRHKSVIVEGE